MRRRGFGLSRGPKWWAVPIAMKRLANLSGGYNPFRKLFFESLVSPSSQPSFQWVDPGLNVRVEGL
jgi:hypothetical protein